MCRPPVAEVWRKANDLASGGVRGSLRTADGSRTVICSTSDTLAYWNASRSSYAIWKNSPINVLILITSILNPNAAPGARFMNRRGLLAKV